MKIKTGTKLEFICKERWNTNDPLQLPVQEEPNIHHIYDFLEKSFLIDETVREKILGLTQMYIDLKNNGVTIHASVAVAAKITEDGGGEGGGTSNGFKFEQNRKRLVDVYYTSICIRSGQNSLDGFLVEHRICNEEVVVDIPFLHLSLLRFWICEIRRNCLKSRKYSKRKATSTIHPTIHLQQAILVIRMNIFGFLIIRDFPRYGRKDSVDCSDDRDLRNPVPVEHPPITKREMLINRSGKTILGQSSRDRLACQRADIRRLRPTAPRKLDDIGSKVQDDVIQVNDEAKQFLDFVHRVSSTLAKGRKRTDAIESDVNKFRNPLLEFENPSAGKSASEPRGKERGPLGHLTLRKGEKLVPSSTMYAL
ncbi:hypothetical protein KY290_006407 [Solanum tuberosum]|uniref:Uncharacterized protein n=1 Tax=Solanum tuberosum TaxID=4113 RepID=A0ABQ7WGX1_SOLTU|nr:hypothetical protein KY290_006407 [Solanum tuberosum]